MRKNNNQYLERINESVTGQTVDVRRTNNWYLRSIAKNTGSEEIHGHRTDNYYLRRIALNMEDLDVKELLETIAELRGEVEELEELLANDIHLFSCCKDIVQTGESLGLFAYCKHNGEVEGNTVYFYAIDHALIPSTITITSDKTVLSYSDNDKVTLTITVLNDDDNPLSNCDVVIKNGSTVLDTVQTDNNGIAEYEYTSQGVGDVTFTVKCMNLQETYEIQDCIKYDSNTYSAHHDYNLQLPSTYSLEFDIIKKGTSQGSTGAIVLGTSSNYFDVGCGSSDDLYVSRWRTNSSIENLFTLTQNEWKTIILEVNGSTVDIKADGNTYTVTGVTTTSSLYQINCNNADLNFKNLKIKPL